MNTNLYMNMLHNILYISTFFFGGKYILKYSK